MSKKCPQCKASTRTRATEEVTDSEWKTYHQCNNLYCGLCFVTLTTIIKGQWRQPKNQGGQPSGV